MPLTDVVCRNAKAGSRVIKLSDGGGLFLLVQPSGSKLWRMAYRFQRKQKTLAFGTYPVVGLKEARERRDSAKELLARNVDPSEEKKVRARKALLAANNSFESVAREWFANRESGWSKSHSSRLLRRLESDIFPVLGPKPISAIEPLEILDAVRKVESRDAVVLAKRLLQSCSQIFRYAVATSRAVRDPSQDLRGALKTAGPKKRRAALRANELPTFLSKLNSYEGHEITVLALKLVLHTFLRTAEVRFGRWAEIESLEGEYPLWRIPNERMKARNEHLVPLTSSSVSILKSLKQKSGRSPYILPASTKEGVISQNTLIYALYRMGYHSRATVHGFRGTASTILNESGFNRDWIERQLAHAERDDVRAAYNSAEWLGERRGMMEWWSKYLNAAELQGVHRGDVL